MRVSRQIACFVLAAPLLSGCTPQPARADARAHAPTPSIPEPSPKPVIGTVASPGSGIPRMIIFGRPETIRTFVEPPPPQPTAVYSSLLAVRDTLGAMIHRSLAARDTAIHVTRD